MTGLPCLPTNAIRVISASIHGPTALRLRCRTSWRCLCNNSRSDQGVNSSSPSPFRTTTCVLEKVGLRLEGRLRENEYFKGRWLDTLIYGLLESEWRTMSSNS
jgi:hypothetical protein